MFFGANENHIPLKYINTIKEKKLEAISRMEEMKKSEPRIDIEQGLKEHTFKEILSINSRSFIKLNGIVLTT